MSLLVPNEGETRLLLELLDGGTARENWLLDLYSSATTPAETDTVATYTICNFTGYAQKTLTRTIAAATWQTVASVAPTGAWSGEALVAESTYGSAAQSWSATSAQTVVGYLISGATSLKLIAAEKFGSSIALVNPSSLTMTPRIGLS